MTEREPLILRCALRYASVGWAVFPCKPGEKVPNCPHGCKDATTDEERVRRWWEAHPDDNIGIATGSVSGLLVVDCDGDVGLANFLDLASPETPMEGTLTCNTPGGGLHAYYLSDDPRAKNSASKIAVKVDSRGEGGYVLAPPSVHPNGGVYSFQSWVTLARAPEWLLQRIQRNEDQTSRVLESLEFQINAPQINAPGFGYAQALLEGVDLDVRAAPVGERNQMLYRKAFKAFLYVASGELEQEEVVTRMNEAGIANGLEQAEVLRTIRSAAMGARERGGP